jgi:N-acetylmuramoyl-L-alanine amidase
LTQAVRPFQRSKLPIALAGLAALALLLRPAHQARSDNFVFYLPGSHTIMPLEAIGKASYLPLLKVLNLVGTVGALEEKRGTLKVWLGPTSLTLRQGERRVYVNATPLSLSYPVEVSGGQWMVPADFLYSVLPRLSRQPLQYRVGDRRMFIGNVNPVTFSVHLEPLPHGVNVVVEFSGSVSVESAATNGRWVAFLGGTPVQPLESVFRFRNPYVSAIQFDDQDGVPKLIITPTSGSLNFYPASAAGRIWEARVVEPEAAATTAQAPPQPPAAPPAAPPPSGPAEVAPAPAPPPPLPAVVLDAGHGGPDAGARSRDGVLEKNVAAQLVDRARAAVEATGHLRVVLTRAGDSDPTFDERDLTANLARPVAFLTFHAGEAGGPSPRVMLYTYEPSSPPPPGPPFFIPWQWAQQPHAAASRQLAAVLADQFSHIPGLTVMHPDRAPVRSLRSVNAPAVAIELGSLAPNADAGAVASPALEQQIAAAIAQVLANWAGGP